MGFFVEARARAFKVLCIFEVAAAVEAVDMHGAKVREQSYEPDGAVLWRVELVALKQFFPLGFCTFEGSNLHLPYWGKLRAARAAIIRCQQRVPSTGQAVHTNALRLGFVAATFGAGISLAYATDTLL